MDIFQGARVGSQKVHVQADVSAFDIAFYEGCITNLFLPWIIDEIPDDKWQTLQKKLKLILLKMLSNVRGNK